MVSFTAFPRLSAAVRLVLREASRENRMRWAASFLPLQETRGFAGILRWPSFSKLTSRVIEVTGVRRAVVLFHCVLNWLGDLVQVIAPPDTSSFVDRELGCE